MDFDTFLQRVGRNVRRARWAAGLTQQDVASRGISLRYFADLERGRRNPTLEVLFRLARILDTTVGALTDVTPQQTSKARATLEDPGLVAPPKGRRPKRR